MRYLVLSAVMTSTICDCLCRLRAGQSIRFATCRFYKIGRLDNLIQNIQAHIAVSLQDILARGAVFDLGHQRAHGIHVEIEGPAQRYERVVGERPDVLLRLESVIKRAAVN